MSKPFLVHLPYDLYTEAKEYSRREGPPMSFLVRKGLHLVLERVERRVKTGDATKRRLSKEDSF